jgi:hypothetical protein
MSAPARPFIPSMDDTDPHAGTTRGNRLARRRGIGGGAQKEGPTTSTTTGHNADLESVRPSHGDIGSIKPLACTGFGASAKMTPSFVAPGEVFMCLNSDSTARASPSPDSRSNRLHAHTAEIRHKTKINVRRHHDATNRNMGPLTRGSSCTCTNSPHNYDGKHMLSSTSKAGGHFSPRHHVHANADKGFLKILRIHLIT